MTDVCAVITNVLIATSKQLGVDASRQIQVSREEMVLALHLAKAHLDAAHLVWPPSRLAHDLSQIDVCYWGEPGLDANMPVCRILTLAA